MSMLLRRHMMIPNAGGGGLPAEYQQVAYLQAPSGQYIVTDIAPTYPDFVITLEAELLHNKTGDQCLSGCSVASNYRCGGLGYYRNHFQNFYGPYLNIGDIVDRKAIYKVVMSQGSQVGYIDDVQVGTNDKTFTVSGENITNFAIFGCLRSNLSGIDYPFTGECYWLKIYIDNALAGHFIPCYRKSDNEPGMYDTVSGTFYTNAGSGDFIIPT